jgi:chromate reductase
MFGAVWAQAETRKVLGALGARVVDEELPVAKAPEGLDDPQLRARLAHLLALLVDTETQLRAA